MLQIESLSFGYHSEKILDSISLELEKERIVSILGASGCGKTTLFKLIAGMLRPRSGSVTIFGKEVEKSVSYMMQEDLLLEWKSVLKNLLMVFEIQNPFSFFSISSYFKKRKAFEKKARGLLEEVGLKGFEHHYPKMLSKGMRQRVSLARTILFERPFLLLDEPFSALDPGRRKELLSLLLRLKSVYKLGILQITHDLEDAKKVSDEIYYLENATLKRL